MRHFFLIVALGEIFYGIVLGQSTFYETLNPNGGHFPPGAPDEDVDLKESEGGIQLSYFQDDNLLKLGEETQFEYTFEEYPDKNQDILPSTNNPGQFEDAYNFQFNFPISTSSDRENSPVPSTNNKLSRKKRADGWGGWGNWGAKTTTTTTTKQPFIPQNQAYNQRPRLSNGPNGRRRRKDPRRPQNFPGRQNLNPQNGNTNPSNFGQNAPSPNVPNEYPGIPKNFVNDMLSGLNSNLPVLQTSTPQPPPTVMPPGIPNDFPNYSYPPGFFKDMLSGLNNPLPTVASTEDSNEEINAPGPPAPVPPGIPNDYPKFSYPKGFFGDMLSGLNSPLPSIESPEGSNNDAAPAIPLNPEANRPGPPGERGRPLRRRPGSGRPRRRRPKFPQLPITDGIPLTQTTEPNNDFSTPGPETYPVTKTDSISTVPPTDIKTAEINTPEPLAPVPPGIPNDYPKFSYPKGFFGDMLSGLNSPLPSIESPEGSNNAPAIPLNPEANRSGPPGGRGRPLRRRPGSGRPRRRRPKFPQLPITDGIPLTQTTEPNNDFSTPGPETYPVTKTDSISTVPPTDIKTTEINTPEPPAPVPPKIPNDYPKFSYPKGFFGDMLSGLNSTLPPIESPEDSNNDEAPAIPLNPEANRPGTLGERRPFGRGRPQRRRPESGRPRRRRPKFPQLPITEGIPLTQTTEPNNDFSTPGPETYPVTKTDSISTVPPTDIKTTEIIGEDSSEYDTIDNSDTDKNNSSEEDNDYSLIFPNTNYSMIAGPQMFSQPRETYETLMTPDRNRTKNVYKINEHHPRDNTTMYRRRGSYRPHRNGYRIKQRRRPFGNRMRDGNDTVNYRPSQIKRRRKKIHKNYPIEYETNYNSKNLSEKSYWYDFDEPDDDEDQSIGFNNTYNNLLSFLKPESSLRTPSPLNSNEKSESYDFDKIDKDYSPIIGSAREPDDNDNNSRPKPDELLNASNDYSNENYPHRDMNQSMGFNNTYNNLLSFLRSAFGSSLTTPSSLYSSQKPDLYNVDEPDNNYSQIIGSAKEPDSDNNSKPKPDKLLKASNDDSNDNHPDHGTDQSIGFDSTYNKLLSFLKSAFGSSASTSPPPTSTHEEISGVYDEADDGIDETSKQFETTMKRGLGMPTTTEMTSYHTPSSSLELPTITQTEFIATDESTISLARTTVPENSLQTSNIPTMLESQQTTTLSILDSAETPSPSIESDDDDNSTSSVLNYFRNLFGGLRNNSYNSSIPNINETIDEIIDEERSENRTVLRRKNNFPKRRKMRRRKKGRVHKRPNNTNLPTESTDVSFDEPDFSSFDKYLSNFWPKDSSSSITELINTKEPYTSTLITQSSDIDTQKSTTEQPLTPSKLTAIQSTPMLVPSSTEISSTSEKTFSTFPEKIYTTPEAYTEMPSTSTLMPTISAMKPSSSSQIPSTSTSMSTETLISAPIEILSTTTIETPTTSTEGVPSTTTEIASTVTEMPATTILTTSTMIPSSTETISSSTGIFSTSMKPTETTLAPIETSTESATSSTVITSESTEIPSTSPEMFSTSMKLPETTTSPVETSAGTETLSTAVTLESTEIPSTPTEMIVTMMPSSPIEISPTTQVPSKIPEMIPQSETPSTEISITSTQISLTSQSDQTSSETELTSTETPITPTKISLTSQSEQTSLETELTSTEIPITTTQISLTSQSDQTSSETELTSTETPITSTQISLTSQNEQTSLETELTSTEIPITTTQISLTSQSDQTSSETELTSTETPITSTQISLTSQSDQTSSETELTSTETPITSTPISLTSQIEQTSLETELTSTEIPITTTQISLTSQSEQTSSKTELTSTESLSTFDASSFSSTPPSLSSTAEITTVSEIHISSTESLTIPSAIPSATDASLTSTENLLSSTEVPASSTELLTETTSAEPISTETVLSSSQTTVSPTIVLSTTESSSTLTESIQTSSDKFSTSAVSDETLMYLTTSTTASESVTPDYQTSTAFESITTETIADLTSNVQDTVTTEMASTKEENDSQKLTTAGLLSTNGEVTEMPKVSGNSTSDMDEDEGENLPVTAIPPPGVECKVNETYYSCVPHCQHTCFNFDSDVPCLPNFCEPGCFCSPGLVIDENGKCVDVKDCYQQACGIDEEWWDCKPECHNTCENYARAEACQDLTCTAGCFCREGLIRDVDGSCVDPEECAEPVCLEHEEETDCMSPCNRCTANCHSCKFFMCRAGCDCRDGFKRDEKGVCIQAAKCPKCDVPSSDSANSTIVN